MELKLTQIPNGEERFATTQSGVFVTEDNYQKLSHEINLGEFDTLLVKVECSQILSKFKIYSQLDKLSRNIQGDDECIFVHRGSINQDIIDNGKLSVQVSPFKLDNLPYATEVKIQLPEKDVEIWSDDEINHALSVFKAKNDYIQNNQYFDIVPKTKAKVKGKITTVSTLDMFSFEDLYRINDETKITFLGLPEKRQKVLEFSEIGGLDDIVVRLREIIQLPLNYPKLFERFNIKPYRGILLYGPPGNGKTMIAKALAHSLGAKFFSIEGAELMSKYVSVGEQELRKVFEDAEEAGRGIIFIDELDAIAVDRNDNSEGYEVRYVTTLLTLMDGMKNSKSRIVIMGATNRVEALDSALRRPGRFDLDFEIPFPNAENRYKIFKLYCNSSKSPLEDNVDETYLKDLCDQADGFSGADLAGVYRESAMNAIRRNLKIDNLGKTFVSNEKDIKINKEDLEKAFIKFESHNKRTKYND